MTRADALALLELGEGADRAAIESVARAKVRECLLKLEQAPGRSLEQLYEKRLRDLQAAAAVLAVTLTNDAPSAGTAARSEPEYRAPSTESEDAAPKKAHTSGPVASPRESASQSGYIPIVFVVALIASTAAYWFVKHNGRTSSESMTGLTFVATPDLPFSIGETEVTYDQFSKFVSATNYVTDAERSGHCSVYAKGASEERPVTWRNAFAAAAQLPVVCVSWNDANAYAAWASSQTGVGVRLPSEQEWQALAAAGAQTAYSFGDDLNDLADYGNAAGSESPFEWSRKVAYSDLFPGIAAVAQFKSNDFGVYDVHGNVWEWTSDKYSDALMVLRGGGWASHPANATSRVRNGMKPDAGSNDVGFRVVRNHVRTK